MIYHLQKIIDRPRVQTSTSLKEMAMKELANITEIEISQIYRIENAVRNVRPTTIFTIARILNAHPQELLADHKD